MSSSVGGSSHQSHGSTSGSVSTSGQGRHLSVSAQSCMDAMGQRGVYTGVLEVESGLPVSQGTMEYPVNESTATNVKCYQGDWQDGYWQGQGHCDLQNGDAYVGQFVRHERHGMGEYIWNEQSKDNTTKQRSYKGQFQHNQRQGHGKYVWKTLQTKADSDTPTVVSMSSYTGWFEAGQRQGHGVYSSAKLQYTGEWWQGQYQGYGVLELKARGTVYRGNFVQGQRQGRGTEIRLQDNAVIHDGMWHQDHPQEKEPTPEPTDIPPPAQRAVSSSSTISTQSGAQQQPITSTVFATPQRLQDANGFPGLYKGIVEQGLPQGVGTMTYPEQGYDLDNDDIAEYEGFWQAGVKHGFGRITYRDGDTYQGNLVKNLRQGQGEYIMQLPASSGDTPTRSYKGMFQRHVPHGVDFQVVYPNGDLFYGEYQQGQRQGPGKMEFANGTFYDGHFDDGMYQGMGKLVTEYIVYQGEFQQGVYQGNGCLRNGHTNAVLYDGEWNEGEPAGKRTHPLSKEQLAIPHPPMDDPFSITNNSDVVNTEGGDTAGALPTLVRQLSPLPLQRQVSPVPKGTVPPPEPPKASAPAPGITTSLTSSLLATWMGGSTEKKPPPKKEECKAVVDMNVWDGQDNPGRYTGLLHVETQRPHGVGRMVYGDGNRIHEGFWEYGHRQGHGRCLFVQIGDYHEGNYHQNLRQGPGKYYWKDGRQYDGDYQQDERQGHGRFVYPNGDVYEGEFVKGQRQGQGTFVFGQKSCRYQGQWHQGLYAGKGRLEWQAQGGQIHVYMGEFDQGIFHGRGVESLDGRVLRQGLWEQGNFVQAMDGMAATADMTQSMASLDMMDDVSLSSNSRAASVDPSTVANSHHSQESYQQPTRTDSLQERPSRRDKESKPDRNVSSAECASSVEQDYDMQRMQWRESLEPANN